MTLFVLIISACGGAPSGDVAPAPAPSPVVSPSLGDAPEVAAAPAWSDLEILEELMEANGRNMKELKALVQQGDPAGAQAPARELQGRFEEIQTRSLSFAGNEPERFRAFADGAAIASRELAVSLATDSAPVDPVETRRLFERIQEACKNCHDVYHADHDGHHAH